MQSIEAKENLLTEQEIETLKQIHKFKRDILSYLDLNEFIKQAIKVIENAKVFGFRSATSKLTINKTKPVFVLKIKESRILKRLIIMEEDENTQMKVLDEITEMLNNEIIKELSKILTDSIKEHDSELFVGVPEEIKTFIISNIYSIRFSLKENNIQLYYFF